MIGRYRLTQTLAVAGAALLLTTSVARADSMEWTMWDNHGEGLSITNDLAGDGSAIITQSSCDAAVVGAEESCILWYTRPGAEIRQILTAGGGVLVDPGYLTTAVLEGDGSALSDRLFNGAFDANGGISFPLTEYVGYLFSDDEQGNIACGDGCGWPETATVRETGGRQFMSQIFWSDGSIDSLFFASDVEAPAVPEPASLLLLGTGLLFGARAWRKRQPTA